MSGDTKRAFFLKASKFLNIEFLMKLLFLR